VAAIYRLTSVQAEALAQPWPVRPQGPAWLRRSYPVALVAALPLIGWKAHLLSADGQGAPLLGAAVILATLLGLRSWLAALETAHHRLGSVTDPLTGAYNGAYVGRRLGTVVGGGETTHGRACLVVTRIDDFSRIDQVHGREAGDEVLRGCAGLMRTAAGGARSELFRVHDAEFLELLLEGDTSAGVAYATRLNGLIQEEREQTSGARFSISCGVTELEPGETDWQQVLERARDAASVAADEGGERIRVFTSADVRADRLAHDPRGRDLRSAMFELAKAADARDPYAAEHSARVERLAVLLASDLGMREEVLEAVRCAALLHDIGKIGVSMRVLSKPAALSADERAAVERHCELGERLLRASGLADVAVFVRHHHERWDGEGYPDRLVATDIPLEARLISVCDALETLTAPRPYRNALTLEQALCEIEDSSGSRYDPELAQRLVAILRSSDLPPLDFRPQPLENEATAS
ncbi:MAG TPA: HD domain-containing phosphohydrolase, partial [Coriobacteriia bacterium]|nr:HD domain-containing phosphohydrolase [Coriobacteriia bacterium]